MEVLLKVNDKKEAFRVHWCNEYRWCKIDLEIDDLLAHQGEHGEDTPINLKLRLSRLPFKPTEAFLAKEATPEQQAIVDDLWGNKK